MTTATVAVLILSAGVVLAQAAGGGGDGHDHAHAAAGQPGNIAFEPTASPVDADTEEAIYAAHFAPELAANAARIAGGNVDGLRTRLRSALGAAREAAQRRYPEPEAVDQRAGVLQNVRARVLEEGEKLALSPAAEAAFHAVLRAAAEDDLDRLRGYLWTAIICWCLDENWTKTLSGCPDGCSNEQKDLVDRWLLAGYTPNEIIDRMIAHPKGGERVRGYLEATGWNILSYAVPIGLFVGAFVFAGLFLRRSARAAHPPGASEESSRGGAGGAEDERLAEQIEKELKEMDR